jgi:ribosomal protein S18 acetylase RimI-like enzyme
MPSLADWPRVEFVVPADYAPLATFSCGASTPWESEIDSIFRGLGSSRELRIRIAEDSLEGDLIGAGLYGRRSPSTHMPAPVDHDAAYISALGITEGYRGWRMPDDSRVGEFLLEDLLLQIQSDWDDEMPAVWAMVAIDNTPCNRLVDAFGFVNVPADVGGYDIWYRQRGLDPEWWRDT